MNMALIKIDDLTIYDGPLVAVPRAGDDIHHRGEVVRVEAVTWQFESATDDTVTVTLGVGKRPYTF
jgi:hypothetical protein